jgi:hypothetical protein
VNEGAEEQESGEDLRSKKCRFSDARARDPRFPPCSADPRPSCRWCPRRRTACRCSRDFSRIVAPSHRHTVTPSHRRHPHPPHCPHAKGGAPRGAPPCVHHASAPLRETLDWWRGMWLERNLKRRPAPRQRRRRRGPVSTILGIAGFMEHTEDEARRLEGGSGGVPNLPGSRGHGEPGHAASLNARSGATCGLRPGTLRGPLARRDGRKPWRVFGITQNNRPTPCSSCTRDCMSASK